MGTTSTRSVVLQMNRRDIFKGLVGAPVAVVAVNPWDDLAKYNCSNSGYYREKQREWNEEHRPRTEFQIGLRVMCPSCSMVMFYFNDEFTSYVDRVECGTRHCPQFGVQYNPPTMELERV